MRTTAIAVTLFAILTTGASAQYATVYGPEQQQAAVPVAPAPNNLAPAVRVTPAQPQAGNLAPAVRVSPSAPKAQRKTAGVLHCTGKLDTRFNPPKCVGGQFKRISKQEADRMTRARPFSFW